MGLEPRLLAAGARSPELSPVSSLRRARRPRESRARPLRPRAHSSRRRPHRQTRLPARLRTGEALDALARPPARAHLGHLAPRHRPPAALARLRPRPRQTRGAPALRRRPPLREGAAMTLVSTVIPVFNRAAMLDAAVASVLAQTHRPIEIVVVDDGSTDDTPARADAIAAAHPEVVVIHQSNAGPGAAREAGRRAARGEFVQFLDSDDLLWPRKFELQVAALERAPECGVAYGWTRLIVNGAIDEKPWKHTGERIETMFPSMLQSRWWGTPTPLYRAAVLERAGGWTSLRTEEDWELDCRIAALGVRLAYVEEWVSDSIFHGGEQLSVGAPARTAAVLRDRAKAHALILGHARADADRNTTRLNSSHIPLPRLPS